MTSPSVHCPNCSAELPDGAASYKCVKCKAVFGDGASWAPIPEQEVKTSSVPPGLSVLKFIAGGIWIAIAVLLLVIAANASSGGSEAASMTGLIFLVIGGGIASARTATGVFIGLVATAAILLVGFVLLQLIGAAIYAR